MAFSMSSNGSGGRSGLRGRRFGGSMGTLSEMNVVPMVDVVLVLLIIFMLTAQAMDFGLDIQVPQVKHVTSTVQELPVISITRGGKLYLGDKPLNHINTIDDEIQRRYKGAKAVYVQADATAMVEQFANVVSELGHAHYEVKFVTKMMEGQP
jgi:biopolymer transport protein ExbD